mmetsp:Transcript_6714/g.17130  ORF Transcript_6714/g.17130 Transcript_6714/m.17130 type:complete len:183 (+) Transcript_6714:78-626(+)
MRLAAGRPLLVAAAVAWLCQPGLGQYDFPIDSCACHIHYEAWVQLQHQLSLLLTEDFPTQLAEEGSLTRAIVNKEECRDPYSIENELEWTLGPATGDCAPGHMSHYVLCAQQYLAAGDVPTARKYMEFANYMLPFATPCMDPEIWTLTPEALRRHHNALVLASEGLAGDAGLADLAYQPNAR